jgi:hypothetical protein
MIGLTQPWNRLARSLAPWHVQTFSRKVACMPRGGPYGARGGRAGLAPDRGR